jgi:hypothetical protein
MSGTEADLPLINCCVNQDATFRNTGEGVSAFQILKAIAPQMLEGPYTAKRTY